MSKKINRRTFLKLVGAGSAATALTVAGCKNKQTEAAGCILPVSHDLSIPKDLGLRHRAALGISQETDALAIIVSEETGGISAAYKGQFHLRLTAEELERLLTKED